MRVSSSAAVRTECRVRGAVVHALERRVGNAPMDELWSRRELRAHLTNPVAQCDHRVESLGAELIEVFGAVGADVDPVRVKDPDGVGMQRLRTAAGADSLDRPCRHVLEQRFCDLRPGAVTRAEEQHPRPATRVPSSWTRGFRGREPQRGVQCAPCALQRLTAGGQVDRVVAVASVGRALAGVDQGTFAKQAQVVRDQALRLVDQDHQLAHGPIALHQLLQQPPPKRVRRQPHEGWWLAGQPLHSSDSSDLPRINQIRLMYRARDAAIGRRNVELRLVAGASRCSRGGTADSDAAEFSLAAYWLWDAESGEVLRAFVVPSPDFGPSITELAAR